MAPFPGMDPWLEDPGLFPDLHDQMIACLRESLQPALPERYFAAIQDRIVVEETESRFVPDVAVLDRGGARKAGPRHEEERPAAVVIEDASLEVREPFIEIRDLRSGRKVVTIIEILSPGNKRPAADAGRQYRAKQEEILRSDVSLVEIDLLRGGEHIVAVNARRLEPHRPFSYLVVVRRAVRPRAREVYPIPLRSPLPRVRVPLREPDPDVEADLQAILDRAWAAGAYFKRVDYGRSPDPPLSDEDAAWARGRVASAPPGR